MTSERIVENILQEDERKTAEKAVKNILGKE